MDTFIDKLAQKKNAQEMILANMTAEMRQMQNQVKEYDELMQEIRRVNLKTAENLSDVKNTLQKYMIKLKALQEDNSRDDETRLAIMQLKGLLEDNSRHEETKQVLDQIKRLLEDNSREEEIKQALTQIIGLLEDNSENEEKTEELTQLRESLDEKFKQSDEFLHKESVKVYRNVQAAMQEELNKQTEELKQSQKENKGNKALVPISILILLAVLADIAIHLFSITIPIPIPM